MPHPGLSELVRRMQMVPRTSRGFQSLMPDIRALRTALVAQGDQAGLFELAEKVRLWAPGEKAPAVTARVLSEAADVLADAGQWQRAAQLIERAVQANPLDVAVVDRAHTTLMRGKAYEDLHDILTTHAHLLDRRAPSETTLRASCWQRLGKLRADRLANLDGAIAAYDTSIQIEPEVNAVRELAVLLEMRGRPDDRESAADLYCLLGELVGGDEGAMYYARALNLKPDHPDALAQLGHSPVGVQHQAQMGARSSEPFAVPAARPLSAPPPLPGPADSRFEETVLKSPSSLPPPARQALSGPYMGPTASPFEVTVPDARPLSAPPPAQPAVFGAYQASAQPVLSPGFGEAYAPTAHQAQPPPGFAPAPQIQDAPSFPNPVSAAPVAMAPSFVPDPRPPAPSGDLWQDEVKKRKPAGPRYAVVAAVMLSAVALGVMQRAELRALVTRAQTLVGGLPQASVESVQGSARELAAVGAAAPSGETAPQVAAAQPPVEAAPVEKPEPKEQAVASGEPTSDAVAKPEAETKKAKREPAGSVSLVKNSLRATGGRLPKGALAQALEPTIESFNACYDRALRKKPKLSGKLAFSWVVRPNGRVDRVQKTTDSVKDAAVAACAKRALERTDFPKPRGGVARLRGTFEFDT